MTHIRLNPPFRAEHVGSLLRPRALKDANSARRKGELPDGEYRAILDREVRRAVKLQEDAGLRSITDGEFRRSSWFGFFFEALEGFRLDRSLFRFHDADGHDFEWQTCVAAAPIRRVGDICAEEYLSVRAATTRTPKATMPSPSALHFFRGDDCVDRSAYPDIDAFWDDLVGIYQAEIQALGGLGCTYLQFDEVPLAMLCDSAVRDQVRAAGLDPDGLTRKYVEVVNRVLAARPDGMTVGMHLCRGNFRSRWMAEGGYEPVAETLFNEVGVDAFFLEYDSPRAGDFTPLRLVPTGKTVVLGLVSTKTPVLEDADALKRRIGEAARTLPLEQLALSPQCGFASVAGGNLLTEDDERRKLELVADVARQVWG